MLLVEFRYAIDLTCELRVPADLCGAPIMGWSYPAVGVRVLLRQ